MTLQTLIDGVPGTQIDCTDRGLQYGDGLFETISCVNGRPRWLALHCARLRRGCERLQIPFDGFAALEADIARLMAVSSDAALERCLVKVTVTRGRASRRGYAPAGDERPTRIVTRYEWPRAVSSRDFRVGLAGVTLGVNPRLAGLKHLNRLEQVLAQIECRQAGLDEVLMRSSHGELIGGSMSNLFLVDAQGVSTPALEDCGVAGVVRERILEAGPRAGIAVRVRAIAADELTRVREAFVTNVRWEIRSITELDGRPLRSQDCARRLRELLDAA